MLDEKRVKGAFKQIKAERENFANWIFYLKERIDELSLNLEEIRAIQNNAEEIKKKDIENSKIEGKKLNEPSVNLHPFSNEAQQHFTEFSVESLTELQQKTFFLIGSLQRENINQFIPVRMINSELYGANNIEKMQTTIANYLKRLEDCRLIARMKKGRHSYVALTELGIKTLASHHVEKIKNIASVKLN